MTDFKTLFCRDKDEELYCVDLSLLTNSKKGDKSSTNINVLSDPVMKTLWEPIKLNAYQQLNMI